MKKLLSIVALSSALVGYADDSYLYWMLGNSIELDGESLKTGDYYAKIKGVGSDSYLYLYDQVGGESFGQQFDFTASDSLGMMFAGFTAGSDTSFLVELYASGGDGNPLGYADINGALADFITQPGMSTPASPYAINSFSAVPEPTSGLLLLLGVAGLALRRKKMQKA